MLHRLIILKSMEPTVLSSTLFILHVIIRIPFPFIDDISSIETSGIDFIKIRSMLHWLITRKYRIRHVIVHFIYFICIPFSP